MTEHESVLTIANEATEAGRSQIWPEHTTAEPSGTPEWVTTGAWPVGRIRFGIHPTSTTSSGDTNIFWVSTNTQTSDRHEINHEMEVLEAVARTENSQVFITLLNSLTWANRPADDYVRAVRLCLAIGLHPKARELAMEGASQFPEHADLQRLARLVGPARVIRTDLPPDVNAAANMEWLRKHSDEYRGQYVAVKGGELLATASSYQDLFKKVGPVKGKGILITQVF